MEPRNTPVIFLFCACLVFSLNFALASENPEPIPPEGGTPEQIKNSLPFAIDAGATCPLALRVGHEILYTPKTRQVKIMRSDWRLDALELRLFDGHATVTGSGRIREGRDSEVDATITLRRVDADRLLDFVGFARHGEIQARLSGRIAAAARGKAWQRLSVKLAGEPGTLAISRALLRDLLGQLGGQGLTPATIEKTLTQFFGDAEMIPLDALEAEGGLDGPKLRLKVPLHNPALNVDLEPLIDLGLIWDLWGYIRQSGLEQLDAIHRIK